MQSIFFESLEPRMVLSSMPLPTLEMLAHHDHPVIRVETSLGAFDVEIYTTQFPLRTEAFLTMLRSGRFSENFFHRNVQQQYGQNLFTSQLYTGSFRYDLFEGVLPAESPPPPSPLGWPTTNFLGPSGDGSLAFRATIRNGTTIGGGHWFINVGLPIPDPFNQDRYFGRIIQGMDTVRAIADLPRGDLSDELGTPFGAVPVRGEGSPAEQLVFLTDAQIIKPEGSSAFYEHRIYYPEGYSWQRVLQSLEVVNPNNTAAEYQVIIRYERGTRDSIILMRELSANRRESITISPQNGLSTLVRNHEPYSFEIWSTLPIAASLRHTDFGRPARESFFNPAALPDESLMHSWTFTQSALGAGASNVFLIWQNTAAEPTQVTVTFYFQNADPIEHTYNLGANRRGGLNLHQIQGLPRLEQFTGASITSNVPIVAAITRYDRAPSGHASGGGVMALGTFGGGSTVGIATANWRGPADTMTILNTSAEPVTLNFTLTPRPGAEQTMEMTIPAHRLLVLQGNASPVWTIGAGRAYTVQYEASAPVTVGFISSQFQGLGTRFATWAAEEIHYADASSLVATTSQSFGQSSLAAWNPGPPTNIDMAVRLPGSALPWIRNFAPSTGLNTGATHERSIANLLSTLGGQSLPGARAPYALAIRATSPVVVQQRFAYPPPPIAGSQDGYGPTEFGMPLSPITLLGQTF